MIIRKGYRYRLKTDAINANALARFAGSCRYVWNKALDLQHKRLADGSACLSYVEMNAALQTWKADPTSLWLKDTPAQALQQALMALDCALKDCFDKSSVKRFPRFKKKGLHDAFRYPQGFKLDGSRVYLPKVGWLGFYKSRAWEGVPKNVTVSRHGAHLFISVQCEIDTALPVHPSQTAVGIDMGIRRFATLSDASFFEPLHSFKKLEAKLARAQRKLARKTRGSSNWQKQRDRIGKVHIQIADARSDYLHKISTAISKKHAVVVLEDLRVVNMSRAARGTLEKPGRNVAAKSGLNKSILDQGWGEFRRQLDYKTLWAGGQLVPAAYTSQSCHVCGHVDKGNRKTQADFVCLACGLSANADYNAALNILAAGQAASACGAERARASVLKQEPSGQAA